MIFFWMNIQGHIFSLKSQVNQANIIL